MLLFTNLVVPKISLRHRKRISGFPALESRARPARLRLKPEKKSSSTGSESGRAAAIHMSSGILPFLQQDLGERKAAIFDLGPPTSTKCAYLCSSGAQVYWDNTRTSISNLFHGGTEPDAMQSLLDDWHPPDFQGNIDLVLAWSYFEYLELDQIKKLVSKLGKHLPAGSRLYFLIHHGAEIPDSPPAYELESNDVLRYVPNPNTRTAPCYPPKMLEQMMPGFQIEKLYLMNSGVQEHLFQKA